MFCFDEFRSMSTLIKWEIKLTYYPNQVIKYEGRAFNVKKKP